MSSLAEELRTKVMTADAELYLIGCKALEVGILPEAARRLADAVRDREDLIRVLARHYLEVCIAPDMTGARLSSVRGGQRSSADGQSWHAASHGPVEGQGGQSSVADSARRSRPPSSPVESGGAISEAPTGQSLAASPLSSTVTVRGHLRGARSAVRRKPNPPRGIEAIARVQRAEDRKLFDSFRVRGGIPIGDLTVRQARMIVGTNEREARILRTLCDHVGGAEPSTRLRDAVTPKMLAAAIAQNMEASDVA